MTNNSRRVQVFRQAADEARLYLSPLPVHILADHPEHVRQCYAFLLTSVLSVQGAPSEAQSRLLRLLLDALKLGDIRATLFEQAKAMDERTLLEAAQVIHEAGFARHWLVDMLVLLRLEVPIDEELSSLIGELANLIGLDPDGVEDCAQLAARILGLGKYRSAAAAKAWPRAYSGFRSPAARKSSNPSQRNKSAKPKTFT